MLFNVLGAGSCGDHQVRLVIDPLSGEELCLCRDGYHISNSKYSCTRKYHMYYTVCILYMPKIYMSALS